MSSMPHENGCSCVECCYPQRSLPPVTEVGVAKDRPSACREAARKQCGRNGVPLVTDTFKNPEKEPAKS